MTFLVVLQFLFLFALCCLLLFRSLTVAPDVWYSVCVGRSVLVLLPIRRWTGEVPLDPLWACFSSPRKLAVDLCCLLVLSSTDFYIF